MSEQDRYAHDLFVSYAEADRAWVEGYLIDALTQAGVRCHSEAAFALGVPRLLEFERAVQGSQRTLLVLSPATLAEGFGQFTDLLAQSYGMETTTWPVIPLIVQPVELPPRLAMLTALDAADPDGWPEVVERLCAELQRPGPGPVPGPPCPYPGMVPFGEADSNRFFGRDREAQELVERLRLHPFLTVIGPSGSGKSSLIFAGLVPALRRSGLFGSGEWLARSLRPGESPLAALAAALDPVLVPVLVGQDQGGDPADPARAVSELLAARPHAGRLLLIVDQFEELFTLARSDADPFQQALLRLAQVPDCYLVLTARADFYPDLMATPLWREIQAHRMEVLPLDKEGLRQAIVRPAEGVEVFVETALVERLVADAGKEPGVLPLVQETLVLLWERLERRFLPLSAYEGLVLPRRAYGTPPLTGLQVAMARRADAALGELTPDQRAIGRRIFVRLVQFGEGRADTRRQQPVSALRFAGDKPQMFDRTLEHLTGSRLLTLSGEEDGDGRRVDIAHEALISGWPTLQGWLAERRDAEQTRRRLEAKAGEWARLSGEGGILEEVELLEAERWLASPDAADLGYDDVLPALMGASRAAQEETVAQQRRAVRFRLAALGAIAALVIVALGIGLWSAQRNAAKEHQLAQQRAEAALTAAAYAEAQATLAAEAEARRLEAVDAQATAEAERDRAEQQTRYARSGQLVVQAQTVLATYPQRSLLLSAEALRITLAAGDPRVPAAEDALRQALASNGGRVLSGHKGAIRVAALSPDGRWLVTGSRDATARLWDVSALLDTGSTARDPAAASIVLAGHDGPIWDVAFSSDGQWLVTGSVDATARLWDISALLDTGVTAPDLDATSIVLRGHEEWVRTVVISPDGHWLVTGSEDHTARLWDIPALLGTGSTAPDPDAASIVLRGHEDIVFAAAISPDGRWLATGSSDNTARLWDLTAPNPAAAPIILRGHGGPLWAVAISPDSHWLATGSEDATVRLWDLTAPNPAATPILLRGHEAAVWTVAISADNHWLVTGSADHTAGLWDVSALRAAGSTAADFAGGPVALVLSDQDRVLRGHQGAIEVAAISPDNRWLVTGSWDGTARVWDLAAPDPAAGSVVLRGHEGHILALAISADSQWLITGGEDAAARLWDVSALRDADLTALHPAAAPTVLHGHEGPVHAVAVSPDSRWLVTGSEDATARLWDVPALLDAGLTAPRLAAAPVALRGHAEAVYAAAISPDGQWLVTGSDDTTARLWDVPALLDTGSTTPDPAATSTTLVLSDQDRDQDRVLRGHEDWVRAVAISADSRWLVTGSWDGTARLWDVPALLDTGSTTPDPEADSIVLDGHEGPIWALAISPDSRWLVTGSADATARLWDVSALLDAGLSDPDPETASIVLRGHEGPIWAVAASPDGQWLVTGSADATARLWDVPALLDRGPGDPDRAAESIALVLSDQDRVLRGHEDVVWAVAFSPDSRHLVTGSADATARLWDVSALLDAGLAAPDPEAVSIALRGHEWPIYAVATSPDGHWLVTGSADGTSWLWDLTAPDPAAASTTLVLSDQDRVLRSAGRAIEALAISPDGRWLATGSADGTAWLWHLHLDELVDLACRTAGRNLTRQEWTQYFPGQDYRQTCEQWPLEGE